MQLPFTYPLRMFPNTATTVDLTEMLELQETPAKFLSNRNLISLKNNYSNTYHVGKENHHQPIVFKIDIPNNLLQIILYLKKKFLSIIV